MGTQGKTVAVMQVEAGSQSFNTVPNQSSIPRAYTEFNDDGTLKEGPLRARLVDVVDELFRYTLLLRDQQPFLLQRYSERTAVAAKKHLQETSEVLDAATLKGLANPLVIDVRSEQERSDSKGGVAVPGSFHVPLNVDGNPQSVHQTTAQEFRAKLVDAGIDMNNAPTKNGASFITHCTAGNTPYTGRGNRAAALLRDLGYKEAYNGGSAEGIRAALGESD